MQARICQTELRHPESSSSLLDKFMAPRLDLAEQAGVLSGQGGRGHVGDVSAILLLEQQGGKHFDSPEEVKNPANDNPSC